MKSWAAAGDCFVSHPSTPSCPPYVPANPSGMTHRPSPCTFLSADRPFLNLDSTFVGSATGEGEELQTHGFGRDVSCRMGRMFWLPPRRVLGPAAAGRVRMMMRRRMIPSSKYGNSASSHEGQALGDENALSQH